MNSPLWWSHWYVASCCNRLALRTNEYSYISFHGEWIALILVDSSWIQIQKMNTLVQWNVQNCMIWETFNPDLLIFWVDIQGVSKKRYFLGFLSYFSSGGRILLFCMCFGIRILLLVMNYIHLYHLPPSCWINHHNTNYATSSLTCSQQRRHSFTL